MLIADYFSNSVQMKVILWFQYRSCLLLCIEFLFGFNNPRPSQGCIKLSVSFEQKDYFLIKQSEMIVSVMIKLIFEKNLSLYMFLCSVFNNAINIFKASCIYTLFASKIVNG